MHKEHLPKLAIFQNLQQIPANFKWLKTDFLTRVELDSLMKQITSKGPIISKLSNKLLKNSLLKEKLNGNFKAFWIKVLKGLQNSQDAAKTEPKKDVALNLCIRWDEN